LVDFKYRMHRDAARGARGAVTCTLHGDRAAGGDRCRHRSSRVLGARRYDSPSQSTPQCGSLARPSNAAIDGLDLIRLEPDPEKRLKYLDFIDIYTGLDDNERERYQREHTDEANAMSTFAERFRAEGRSQGIQQGLEQGMQRGEVVMLVRLLERKFGHLPETLRPRIEAADEQTLLAWSERVLSATTLEDVFD